MATSKAALEVITSDITPDLMIKQAMDSLDIREMYQKLGKPNFGFTYKDSQGKDRPYYLLNK